MIAKETDSTMHVLINLALWRRASDLEASKLASMAGIPLADLEAYEAATPADALAAERLADTLGLSLEQLVERDLAPERGQVWHYPRRIRCYVASGKTGRPVLLYELDYLFLFVRGPGRPGGFSADYLAAKTRLRPGRIDELLAGDACTHHELSELAQALGVEATSLLTTD